MSVDDRPQFVPADYWDTLEDRTWFDHLDASQQRRYQRLITEFYAAYRAYSANPATPENPPSLDNCERSPISAETGATDSETVDLSEAEREELQMVVAMGVDDVGRAVDIVTAGRYGADSAIHAALGREKERQWKVLSLLERGDPSHAFRLATCGKRSVQLQCGCCESEDNYVPVSCDSRLCPDCQDSKIGQNIGKYEDRVREMETPVLLTLTEENFSDPIEGRETMMEDLGRLRRRTIPFEGSTRRETEDGEIVEKSWCWWNGTGLEDIDEDQEQWKIKLQAQGRYDLVRRLQTQYVNYEYEDITGTHVGRNIPFEELYDGGIYGIDIKQQGPFEYNVHAHVLIDMAYVPQAALSAVWEDITDGACVVDVRTIYNRQQRENVAEALAETVGYAVKPPEFEDLDDELAFVQAAKGCPTVHPFGSLHGSGSQDGYLICADCEQIPREWHYAGTIDGTHDTMGKTWETDRGMDPPS
jgi:hypothetical protein